MKMHPLFFIAFLSLYCAPLLPARFATTTQVAEADHYSSFMNDLRDKVQDLLKNYFINMNLDVENLRSRNLMNEGDFFELFDQKNYEFISSQFDQAFENIDKLFIAGRNRLDEYASIQEKADFIKVLKLNAATTINGLIRKYKYGNYKKVNKSLTWP